MRKLLQLFLKLLTKRVLARYQPTVIGITGSVGKTSAKEAVYTVLYRKFFVRKTEDNKNNEFGVPMTVLGIGPTLRGLLKAIWLTYGVPRGRYPKILILELGADRPGDISYLTEMVRPQIAVVTAVGEVPVHVEFYPTPQSVAREKAKILKYLGSGGLAVLNYDDPRVHAMKDLTKAKVITFGLSNRADVWASDIAYYLSSENIEGISCKIHHGNSFVPLRVRGLVAAHQLSALLAAAAVGLHFGMNLVEISSALETLEPPKKRMTILRGINGSTILDDSYNASPLSMQAALETLKDFARAMPAGRQDHRKIAVLGDMLELGSYAREAHKKIYELAQKNADIVIVVGELWPNSGETAGPDQAVSPLICQKIKELLQPGDVVLVKGSRAMQMDKIVDEIRQKP